MKAGVNVRVTLEVLQGASTQKGEGSPILLARHGEIPYPKFGLYDEHDFVSHYRGDAIHSILLDREELRVGLWYLVVINAEDATGDLRFTLTAHAAAVLPCPIGPQGDQCSSSGTCVPHLGRCDCDSNRVGDD